MEPRETSKVSSDQLWCKNLNLDEQKIRKAVTERLTKDGSVKALGQLGEVVKDGEINLDFVEHFWHTFNIDEKCKCAAFASRESPFKTKEIDSGKSGDVWELDDGSSKAILKRTKGKVASGPGSITVSAFPTTESAAQMNAANTGFETESGRVVVAVALDNFATQSVIGMLIGIILDFYSKERPRLAQTFARQYEAFVCEGRGYALLEPSNGGDLSSFIQTFSGTDEELDFALCVAIRDVLATLTVLKSSNYGFSHNDLKARNVLVHRISETKTTDPDKYPVLFRIGDFDKSSITFNGVRFYNHGPSKTSKQLPVWFGGRSEAGGVTFYTTNTTYTQIAGTAGDKMRGRFLQTNTMYSPYAFHPTYDIYTLIVSILSEDRVMRMMQTDFVSGNNKFKFARLVQQMFNPLDYQKLINETHGNGSLNVVSGEISRLGIRMATDLSGLFKSVKVDPMHIDEKPLSSKSKIKVPLVPVKPEKPEVLSPKAAPKAAPKASPKAKKAAPALRAYKRAVSRGRPTSVLKSRRNVSPKQVKFTA